MKPFPDEVTNEIRYFKGKIVGFEGGLFKVHYPEDMDSEEMYESEVHSWLIPEDGISDSTFAVAPMFAAFAELREHAYSVVMDDPKNL
eukprot:CAMPEP_0184303208 /NCGR_PEP_ID=MMETSP1049-20130417/13001_1 /TAXON_ID=77928 /ORGANISM="Proteomonas sulcata, Strain CCMP704" /LENGTH=87 /DNA_ID=CAMNT_0026614681 /DNA_START=16 /DNA_END=276 /DNA_ORIENTATION=+